MRELSAENYPPQCTLCRGELIIGTFERQLDGVQHARFLQVGLEANNEVIVQCPRPDCTYFEIHDRSGASSANVGADFCFCRSIACKKVSCLHCLGECVAPSDATRPDANGELNQAQQLGMEAHFACAEKAAVLGDALRAFEDAIERGTSMSCPSCGLRGVKDEACTHMTCASCQTVWCYLCGLDAASEQCSKAPNEGEYANWSDVYRHNVRWYADEARCPMYLSKIGDLDERWPENDDSAALAHFHTQRTLRLLRHVYDRIGADGYRQLVEAYPRCGDACGFSEAQILSVAADAPLYVRSADFTDPEEQLVNEGWGEDEPVNEELVAAAARGDLEGVRDALDAGTDVNTHDTHGHHSLLNAAAESGHVAVVDLLLSRDGIDVNRNDLNQFTPLMLAVQKGHLDAMNRLLRDPRTVLSNVGMNDPWGVPIPRPESAIHIAILWEQNAALEALLHIPEGASPEYLDLRLKLLNGFGDVTVDLAPALVEATIEPSLATVNILLTADGIDVNAAVDLNAAVADHRHSLSGTALMRAARQGIPEIVAALLAQDATEVDLTCGPSEDTALLLTASPRNGTDAVHHAQVASMLLAAGANPNHVNRGGWTPLLKAIRHSYVGVVRELLASSGTDVNLAGGTHYSPLMFAAEMGHLEMVSLLLAVDGIDVHEVRSVPVPPQRPGRGRGPGPGRGRGPGRGQGRGQGELEQQQQMTAYGLASQQGHTEVMAVLRARGGGRD